MEPEFQLALQFEEALKKFQHRTLLSDDLGGWTGREIEKKIGPVIRFIEGSTYPGSRVGVCFPNWAVQAFAIIAVSMARRIPVILSHAEVPKDPQFWLGDGGLSLLVTSEEFAMEELHRLPMLGLNRKFQVKINTTQKTPRLQLADLMAPSMRGTGLVLYTSGSTGRPKGIMVPEIGMLQVAHHLIDYFKLSETTKSPVVLPVCHSMALNTQFIPTFLAGGECFFFNSRLGMSHLYRTILIQAGTFVSLIGDVLHACWEERQKRQLEPCFSVTHVQLAGGLILPAHVRMAQDLFPNALIHKGYGLTEAIRVTMMDHRDPDFLTSVVGRPLPSQKIEVRTVDGGLAAADEPGEIFVAGANVMLGVCHGRSRNLPGPDGFLATGDLGYLSKDGKLSVLGRTDSIFKINGHKVSGIEIEKQALSLSGEFRNVKSVCVFDAQKMRNKLVLFLELPHDRQPDFFQNQLTNFSKNLWLKLKNFSHYPRDIVVLPRFPRTTNGKLKISALEEIWHSELVPFPLHDSSVALNFYTARDESFTPVQTREWRADLN